MPWTCSLSVSRHITTDKVTKIAGRKSGDFFAACWQRGLCCRARQRGAFWLDPWSEDQGLTGSALPAWWFRPHASYLRKEARCRASAKKLPKGTPWKGFLWTPPETEGPRSLWHPGAARYRDFPSWALLRTFKRSIVGYDRFARPDLAQSKFPLEISLRGRCRCRLRWGPHPHRSPPARIFAEQKCLAAAKDCRFAARQPDR